MFSRLQEAHAHLNGLLQARHSDILRVRHILQRQTLQLLPPCKAFEIVQPGWWWPCTAYKHVKLHWKLDEQVWPAMSASDYQCLTACGTPEEAAAQVLVSSACMLRVKHHY